MPAPPSASWNPIRYSVPLVLLLTLCLLYAEHQSAVQMHGNIDLDYVVSKQNGRVTRELAYLTLGALGLIGCYISLIRDRVRLHWNRVFTTILALLLGWTAISLLWTDTAETTSKRLFVLALMFVGAFGITLSWTRTQVLKFMAISAAIQVGVGVVAELIYGYFTPWQADYRFAGTLPWNSQGYVCLVLTLAAVCVVRLREPHRWFYKVLAMFGFVFLLLTRSRGGLLAFTLALVLYLLLTLDARQKILTLLGVTTLATVIAASGVGPTLLSILNRGGEGSENFTGRGPLWDELMTYVARRPLTGYGYEGFWTVTTIDDVSEDQLWAIDNAHSGYIEGLLELGWTGAILHTLALLIGMVEGIRLFRRTREYAWFLAASLCFVYLVGGFLEALFIVKTSQSSFYFAMLLCTLAVQPQVGAAPANNKLIAARASKQAVSVG